LVASYASGVDRRGPACASVGHDNSTPPEKGTVAPGMGGQRMRRVLNQRSENFRFDGTQKDRFAFHILKKTFYMGLPFLDFDCSSRAISLAFLIYSWQGICALIDPHG